MTRPVTQVKTTSNQAPLRHRAFALLYVVGVLAVMLIASAWIEASSAKLVSHYFGAVCVTVLTIPVPLQAIGFAFVIEQSKKGRISRFTALRAIAKI